MSDEMPFNPNDKESLEFYEALIAKEAEYYLKFMDPEVDIVSGAIARLREHDTERKAISEGAEAHLRQYNATARGLGDRVQSFLDAYYDEVIRSGEDTPISPRAEELGRHAESLTSLSTLD